MGSNPSEARIFSSSHFTMHKSFMSKILYEAYFHMAKREIKLIVVVVVKLGPGEPNK